MLRGIELTEAQREQIRAIHEGAREETSAQVKVGDLHRQLQAAICQLPVSSFQLAVAG
jgi:Spy/CpxP family protein refolding chaperone